MFTGIIQEIGLVKKIEDSKGLRTWEIQCNKILSNKKIGDSIAINGACHTVTKLNSKSFECQSIAETLKCTNLGQLKIGDQVNLEGSLKVGDSLDGHFVQGHVDCTAKVLKSHSERKPGSKSNSKEAILKIEKAEQIAKFIVYKGSITINGVSLTISKVDDLSFEVSLIPHTLESTNLKDLHRDDLVNLEADMMARYLVHDKANQ